MARKKIKSKGAVVQQQHEILDGMAYIYRLAQSGDVWQFRMYITAEKKDYRKSLRTRDKTTALQRGRELGLELQGKMINGVKLFGYSLQELVDKYVEYRQEEVDAGIITYGRLVTIKSGLNRFLEILGKDTKVSEIDRDTLYDWRLMRRKNSPNVKDVTVRNEQATLNNLAKFSYRKSYLHFDSFNFKTIRIRQEQVGKRDTFTFEEYKRLYKYMRSYASKKDCADENERLERQLIRDYVLISTNTLLRVGEARQLVWGDIEKIEEAYDSNEEKVKLVYINVRAEISKVRASRRVIARGGEYFDRLKDRQGEGYSNDEDFVFALPNTNKKVTARHWQKHWANLMDGIGISNWKERNLTWYSLRHFGITARVAAGVSAMNISKLAGTSISHIENTYYKHRDEIAKSAALKSFRTTNEGIFVSG
jgi:hypothetical protein